MLERLRIPVWGLLLGAVVAMGALELALITDDFSLRYVADNHTRSTPLFFTIAAAWAALEGSIVRSGAWCSPDTQCGYGAASSRVIAAVRRPSQ